MNLVLSLVALAVGPLLYGLCRKVDGARSLLDGFLFVTIAGIVVVHIVPDVFAVAGITAIVFLALGMLFALAVERRPATNSVQRFSWVAIVGALGLIIHAAMDGIALLPDSHLHGAEGLHDGAHSHDHAHAEDFGALVNNHLALGVILHRIPVGMAIWWTLRPQLGNGLAMAAFALIGGATAGAYFLGDPVFDLLQSDGLACFQAFVAGALLHVIVVPQARRSAERMDESLDFNLLGERLGVIAGLLVIYLVPHAH